jgi:hypothetical protein
MTRHGGAFVNDPSVFDRNRLQKFIQPFIPEPC